MKNLRLRYLLLLAVLAATISPQAAVAQDGALDPGFAADIRHTAEFQTAGSRSAVPLPDGKTLVGGYFTTVDGVPRVNLARLHPNGSLDASFAPAVADGEVVTTYVQADGKILIGGSFTSVNGSGGKRIARLHPDGSTDTSFSSPGADNGALHGILQQPDGKFLIFGNFTAIGGVERRALARLESDGSLDTTFAPSFASATNPTVASAVLSVALQADGKIVVGGNFTLANDQPRSRFARLNSDGSLDSFTLEPNNAVSSLLFQPDGKLVVAGSFSTARGEARPRILRLLPDGSFDNGFTPPALGTPYAVSLQTDGRLFVAGISFVARLNADGTQDSSWASAVSDAFYSAAQQSDGKVLLTRSSKPPQVDTPWWPVLRLLNAATTQNLAVQAGRIEYLRTGPVPELQSALFQLSTDGGATWTSLGGGSRIAGDSRSWELTGLTIPTQGMVRVLGRGVAAGFPTSSGLVAFQRPYNLSAPELVVEDTAGSALANGATPDFGTLPINGARTLTFTVRNFGNVALTGLGASVSGTDAPLFGVITPPASSVPPDGSTTFTIRFQPFSPGAKSATLHVRSDSGSNNPFHLVLTGKCVDDGGPDWFYDQADGNTFGLATQPDGGLVVVGVFRNIGARPRNRIARFRADGTVDPTFNPDANDIVFQCGVLPDGKIIVAGRFTTVGGVPRSRVARLHPNGSVDAGFVPPNINADVWSLALQPDGKLLVGGAFTEVAGAPSSRVIRLNTDGSPDPSFTAPPLESTVKAIAPTADGKILVGTFGSGSIIRVQADGSLDDTFVVSKPLPVAGMVVQPDGRIVICGNFTAVNGEARQNLARLLPNGALDPTFIQPVNSLAQGLALQADGRMLITGFFTSPRPSLARLHPDATLDSSFVADVVGNYGYGIGLGPRGEILLNGVFESISGVSHPAGGTAWTVRLHNTPGSSVATVASADRVQWLRSGSVSELTWARFDLSTDGGATWSPLGSGTRIAGGWELTGLTLPANGLVRAVGNASSGHQNGGFSTVVETVPFAFRQLQTWRTLHGLAANGTQDSGNASGDGVANLLKFAFNMAPNAGDLSKPNIMVLPENGTAGLPCISIDENGRLVIEFVRRKASSNPGITYTAETGDDLTAFTPLDLSGATVVSIDAHWERVGVVDPTVSLRRFGRVRVQVMP